MRKFLTLFLCCIAIFPASSFAADNTDACGAVICLAGEMNGGRDGGFSCQSYVKKYFGIQVWKKGLFKPNPTSAARQSWLSGCQSAEAGMVSAITSAFGKELR